MNYKEIYKRSKIADEYNNALEKRKGLCLFDESYLQKNIELGAKVLDLGCGTGRHLVRLGKTNEMVGVDISPQMIKIARDILRKEKVEVKTIVGDILDIDTLCQDEKFDAVVMMYHTLGSVVPKQKRLALLKKIREVLSGDGILIFHVHNRNHIKNLKFLLTSCLGYFQKNLEMGDRLVSGGNLDGAVIHFFSRREIKRLLRKSGFKIVEMLDLKWPNEDMLTSGLKGCFYTGGFIVKAKIK